MTLLAAGSGFWLPSFSDLAAVGPMWVLCGTIVALLLGAMAFGRGARTMAGIAMCGAILTGASCFWGFFRVIDNGPWGGLAPVGKPVMLLSDNFSLFISLLVSFFLAAVIALWLFGYFGNAPRTEMHRNAPEFFVLLLGSALGMVMMVSTTHLLMIVIAIEMASLPSYALAGFDKRSSRGAEASLKYVLFGGITSAIMVYGVSLLYGSFRTLDLAVIASQLATDQNSLLTSIGFFCLAAGIGFKISAVPFHFWCPDVFEGASIEVTTWLSVASKAAGLGLICRVMSTCAPGMSTSFATWLAMGIGVFAAITATVGNLSALAQTNIKRLLAWSSISHAGYMLMAAAILVRTGPNDAHPAFSALAMYLVVYMFMNLGAFACAAAVYWQTGSESITAFTGLGRRSPWLAAGMTICLVSLVGLPPLGGFAAKFFLLSNVWSAPNGLQWLVVVAVLNTALSLYYYIKIVRNMYLSDDAQPSLAVPAGPMMLLGLSVLVIVLSGTLAIGPLRSRADDWARNLYFGPAPAQQASANGR